MKTVGIISDTHGRLSATAACALVECDYIIHAGDIGDLGILAELRQYAPVTAVLGNNDYAEYGPSVGSYAVLGVEEVAFVVSHKPKDARRILSQPDIYGSTQYAACVSVHGHVHYPVLLSGAEAAPADWLVCPGSASFPRCGSQASVAFVQVEGPNILNVWIETL